MGKYTTSMSLISMKRRSYRLDYYKHVDTIDMNKGIKYMYVLC